MLYDKICDITTFSNDKHFQEIKKNDHKMRRLCEKVLVEQEIISGHRTFAVRYGFVHSRMNSLSIRITQSKSKIPLV